MTTRLYDLSRLFKNKEQKVNIIDNNEIVATTTIGDMPMKFGTRGVFALGVEDDKTVNITLLRMDKPVQKSRNTLRINTVSSPYTDKSTPVAEY